MLGLSVFPSESADYKEQDYAADQRYAEATEHCFYSRQESHKYEWDAEADCHEGK